jgi:hypothetical protein
MRGIATLQRSGKFSAADLERLEAHFRNHAAAVERFRCAGRGDVIRMWCEGRNECGELLTAFERQALTERHCELFGRWPK